MDAGLPTSWRSLHTALAQLGKGFADIKALVLTHGHFDHIGFAEKLRSEMGVPVYVHDNDVPLTRHPRQYTRARPVSWYLLTQFKAVPIVDFKMACAKQQRGYRLLPLAVPVSHNVI